jgi:hypothetical protein
MNLDSCGRQVIPTSSLSGDVMVLVVIEWLKKVHRGQGKGGVEQMAECMGVSLGEWGWEWPSESDSYTGLTNSG